MPLSVWRLLAAIITVFGGDALNSKAQMTMSDQPTALDLPMTDPLPEATQKYFDICEDKLGMVPNVLKAYAFDVEKLNAFTAMYNDLMLGDSALTKLEREMVAVVVSSINRCFYCQVAHGAAVRELSGDPKLGEMMVMNYRVADITPRQRAMLDFAAKVTTASATVPPRYASAVSFIFCSTKEEISSGWNLKTNPELGELSEKLAN